MKKDGIQTRKRKPKNANQEGKSSKSSSKMAATAAAVTAAAHHEALENKRLIPMYSNMVSGDPNLAYGMQVCRSSPDKVIACSPGGLPAYAPTAVIKHEVSMSPSPSMNMDMMGESHSPRSLSSPITPTSAALNKHLHGLRMSPLDVPATSGQLIVGGDGQGGMYPAVTSVLVPVDHGKLQQGIPSTIIQHHHSS